MKFFHFLLSLLSISDNFHVKSMPSILQTRLRPHLCLCISACIKKDQNEKFNDMTMFENTRNNLLSEMGERQGKSILYLPHPKIYHCKSERMIGIPCLVVGIVEILPKKQARRTFITQEKNSHTRNHK